MKIIQIIFISILILAVTIRVLLSFLHAPQLIKGETLHFETTLLAEPTNHGNYNSISVPFTNGYATQQISMIVPSENNLHYGQTVSIIGKVQVKNFGNGAYFTLYHPKITLLPQKQSQFLAVSFFIRQKMQDIYASVLPQKSAALLLGVVLGVKAQFPQNFLKDLQATGVMHVIAASGMNVTMVGGFLLGIFTVFFKRHTAIALTICGLLLYCIISGLQASILRATVMMGFALGAQFFGRQYSGLYGLLLAACGMLLYNPTWILDVGFQLSFAATVGIFFLKPLLPKWGIISDDIGTTISAQIATLPILIGSFGSYGLLSVLVNALVLWTIPPLMVLGGVGGLIGMVFVPVGQFLILLCEPLLWFFENVVTYFGNLQWTLTLSSLPLVMIVGYYVLLVGWVSFVQLKSELPKEG